jgi:hypothetical protein
MRIRGQPLFE